MSERYFLDSDDDGHWYIVPLSKLEQWTTWIRLANEDPYMNLDMPRGVRQVGGSYTLVTFTDPVIDGDTPGEQR